MINRGGPADVQWGPQDVQYFKIRQNEQLAVDYLLHSALHNLALLQRCITENTYRTSIKN